MSTSEQNTEDLKDLILDRAVYQAGQDQNNILNSLGGSEAEQNYNQLRTEKNEELEKVGAALPLTLKERLDERIGAVGNAFQESDMDVVDAFNTDIKLDTNKFFPEGLPKFTEEDSTSLDLFNFPQGFDPTQSNYLKGAKPNISFQDNLENNIPTSSEDLEVAITASNIQYTNDKEHAWAILKNTKDGEIIQEQLNYINSHKELIEIYDTNNDGIVDYTDALTVTRTSSNNLGGSEKAFGGSVPSNSFKIKNNFIDIQKKRSHALTPMSSWQKGFPLVGGQEWREERYNALKNGLINLTTAITTLPELTYESTYGDQIDPATRLLGGPLGSWLTGQIKGLKPNIQYTEGDNRYQEGTAIDPDTNEPWIPEETFNKFPWLKKMSNPANRPYQRTDSIYEDVGFYGPPALLSLPFVAKALVANKGFALSGWAFKGKALPALGLRTPFGKGAFIEASTFLGGNMLSGEGYAHNYTALTGKSPYTPEYLRSKIQDPTLENYYNYIPEFSQGLPSVATGFSSDPIVRRLMNVSMLFGEEVIFSHVFNVFGKTVFGKGQIGKNFENVFGSGKHSVFGNQTLPEWVETSKFGRKFKHFFEYKATKPKLPLLKKGWNPINIDSIRNIIDDTYGSSSAEDLLKTLHRTNQEKFKVQKEILENKSVQLNLFDGYTLPQELKTKGQGVVLPKDTPVEILNRSNQISENGNFGTRGSAGNIYNPLETERLSKEGISDFDYEKIVSDINSDPRYLTYLKSLTNNELDLDKLYGHVLDRQQDVTGRLSGDLSRKDFWGRDFLKRKMTVKTAKNPNSIQHWFVKNIVAPDLVNQSLLSELRDRAIAATELHQNVNIFSVNGPMKGLADNLVVGLTNVKRSRLILKELAAAKKQGFPITREVLDAIQKRVDESTKGLHANTKQGVEMMMSILKKRNTPEVAKALLDLFRASDDIHNWTDFDKWLQAKLIGGQFNDKIGDSILINEIQEMYINSVLSGPKTPLRALLGTGANLYLNNFNQAVGAILTEPFTGNTINRRASVAKLKGSLELIPESWNIFWKSMESNWSADINDIKTRFKGKRPNAPSKGEFEMLIAAAETRGSEGLQAAARVSNIVNNVNNGRWTNYNTRVLASIDDTARWLLARARAKEKAVLEVLGETGENAQLNEQVLKKIEDNYFNKLLDKEGNIQLTRDSWLRKQFEEITLTEDIGKLGEAFDNLFKLVPQAKPFYLFARTGINGIKLSTKNLPGIGALMDESRAILRHTGDDFTELHKYGIEDHETLAIARSLFTGRQAVGSTVTMIMIQKYMSGELTGNGPADRTLRNAWITSQEWKPNTISFGDLSIDYSALEPYNLLFSAIADIGDNMELMGPEWAEDRIQAVAFVIGRGVTSKTYLAGLHDLIEMVTFQNPRSWYKGIGSVMNNTAPLATLRSDIGQFINPYMKELDSDIWSTIRNRNQWAEGFAKPNPFTDPLPIKYDILNGDPIKNWNFFQRGFNMISPVQLNFKSNSPGRELLKNSNFDLNLSTRSYNGYSFRDDAYARSKFQNAIGNAPVSFNNRSFKNLEEALNYISRLKSIRDSVAQMENDSTNPGKSGLNPNKAYFHNTVINKLFRQAKKNAFLSIQDDPKIKELILKQDELRNANERSNLTTSPLFKLYR